MKSRILVGLALLAAGAAGYAARTPVKVADDPAVEQEIPSAWGPLVAYSVVESGGSVSIGNAVYVDSEGTIRIVQVGAKSVFARIRRTP